MFPTAARLSAQTSVEISLAVRLSRIAVDCGGDDRNCGLGKAGRGVGVLGGEVPARVDGVYVGRSMVLDFAGTDSSAKLPNHE